MATITTNLKLSADEEHALSRLISALCNERGQESLQSVFGKHARAAHNIEMIGQINAALNANR